jgi:chorismate-pyruvate lyase
VSEAAPLVARAATHRERVAAGLDLKALPPALRTLLTTDGTVTETLAALYGEEVGVRVLAQGFGGLEGGEAPELEARAGTPVLDRTIVLVGAESGRVYTAARSRILPEALPQGLKEGLLAGREPLGKLMLEHRLETFREVVACGRGPASRAPGLGASAPAALQTGPDAPVAWRTYRVISGGRPVMSITEVFPEDLPEDLPERLPGRPPGSPPESPPEVPA